MGGLGRWAKRAYDRSPRLGLALVAPFAAADAFAPGIRTLVRDPRRFPIADAHYALAFLSLARQTGDLSYRRRAAAFLDALEQSRCPGEADYCWGYPFDWQTVAGLWPRGTPLITQTPYAFEAFEAAWEAEQRQHHLDVLHSIARFAVERIPVTEVVPGAAAAASTPYDSRRVVNASSYRAVILARAAARFDRDDWLEQALANVRFVLSAQSADGSWPYAVDGLDRFVDNFHTCFVLKSLFKVWRITADEAVLEAIRSGYTFYKHRLLDEDGQPVPFAESPRLVPVPAQPLRLRRGDRARAPAPRARPGCRGDRRPPDERPALRVGRPRRVLRDRAAARRMEPRPVHRWAQAQTFHALVRRLEAGASLARR